MNLREFSVSELSQCIQALIEQCFYTVKVRGEIIEISKPSSGHIYIQLKEGNALLKCICWKNNTKNLIDDIKTGITVSCSGDLTTYSQSSCYQLIINKMEYVDYGKILENIKKIEEKLRKEGLFDLNKKKKIPKIPESIGIITSLSGAAIKDVLHRITERFPCKVIIFSALMQGRDSVEQIINGIKYFEKNPTSVLIITRGGGSVEDLMPYNDERLTRAVANCSLPTVSAIGHETDVSLIDYAADLRASTPTAAVEFTTPTQTDLKKTINTSRSFLTNNLNTKIIFFYNKIHTNVVVLEKYHEKINQKQNSMLMFCFKILVFFKKNHQTHFNNLQKIKNLEIFLKRTILINENRVKNSFKKNIIKMILLNFSFIRKFSIIISPKIKIVFYQSVLQKNIKIISLLLDRKFSKIECQLKIASNIIKNNNHDNIFKKGFSLIYDLNGNQIKEKQNIEKNTKIEIRFIEKSIFALTV